MTPRSIRRAAERKANKLARKAERITFEAEPPPPEAIKAKVSSAQGDFQPVVRGSMWGAVKTALTGRTVLLPTDDAAEYERHLQAFEKELRPAGLRECDLVQSLADISWRLRRIPALEMAIYALGRVEFAGLFEDQEDPGVRRSLIELHTHLTYEKQLRNLQLQEARLAHRREKEAAELRTLQNERTGRLVPVVRVEKQRNQREKAHGFEFSIQENEQYVEDASVSSLWGGPPGPRPTSSSACSTVLKTEPPHDSVRIGEN